MAGLLDQERPNIFAQRVANILPGRAIDVILEFDHEIACEDGSCEYVFPTVVGPRFIPARQTNPGAVDPPVVEDGRTTGQALSLSVKMEAGVEVRDLTSPSHRIVVNWPDLTRARVVLAEGDASRLNRDFRLRWRVGGVRPELGLLAYRDSDHRGTPGVFTLILQPPADTSDVQAVPRELVFVLDCSGSMSGVPIEAAKNVIRKALAAVRPQDTFQILKFSDRASGLSTTPLPPTPRNIQRALAYLNTLNGEGGTEMISGIRQALRPPADPDRIRIVAFLTDGYIGNEREIFAEVRKSIGGARLFSFGIGSSVNRYLLEGLAEEGRGVAAFLGPRETPDEMVDRFIRRIETPVLTDIRIIWEDLDVEDLEPAQVPDLFAGQALLIHGRYRRPGTGLVMVEGRRGGRTEILRKVAIFRDSETDHEALGRLWARSRIHRLERELHDGPRQDLTEAITNLGLTYRLMTAYTSLVAVDSEVSNFSGTATAVEVPVEMPEDVSYEGIFSGRRALVAAAAPVSALGYLSPSGPMKEKFRGAPTEADRAFYPSGDEARPRSEESKNQPASRLADGRKDLSFIRLTLFQADGSRIVVEADGEVWKVEPRRRTLVRSLSAAELDQLRQALSTASPAGWAGADRLGARLVAEGPWGTRSVSLPSTDPAVLSLIQTLERWGT